MKSLFAHPWLAHPWLRRIIATGLLAGLLLAGWLAVLTARSYANYRELGRQPYRTSHARIAAKTAVSTWLDPVYDAWLLHRGPLPIYDLEVSQRRLDEWRTVLRRVYARGQAEAADQMYFPAEFSHRDLNIEVDIRSRGTLFSHYKVEKPSLRIKFPKDEFFRQSRMTNLIVPYDQARVTGDPTMNAIARHYDLLTYPTRFVMLRLNRQVLGVYQEVEHFRKELAVKQFRSEGLFMSSLGEVKGGADPGANPLFAKARQEVAQCVTEVCTSQQVETLLDSHLDGEKLAAYAALTSLFGSPHGWYEDNLILFFDPPRGRFEPIPWDMGALRLPSDDDAALETVARLGESLLSRPEFHHRRNQLAWDMIQRKREFGLAESQRLFQRLAPALDHDIEHSRRYARRMVSYFEDTLKHNFDLWQQYLQKRQLQIVPRHQGFRLINHAAAAVKVEALTWPDGTQTPVDLTVPGSYRDQLAEAWLPLHAFPLGKERLIVAPGLEATNTISGEPLLAEHITWSPPGPKDKAADAAAAMQTTGAIASNSESITATEPPAGIRATREDGVVTWVFAGSLRLDQDLTVPPGIRVRFAPGLRLVLAPTVSLFMQGDLLSLGTAERPIWIGAEDPSQPFGVVAVVGRSHRKAAAVVTHTTFQGGAEADFKTAHISGMFSVYDGSLKISQSRLLDVTGEDGLNVKFGSVEMIDNVIERTFSDAVDFDFCDGVVRGNTIRGAGGDSLDFSGSLILADDNQLLDSSDKGLSIGEDTLVLMTNNEVRGAITGLAVKDRSLAEWQTGIFDMLQIGISVYQKKQVFGSGAVVFDQPPTSTIATPFLTDPKARLQQAQQP